MKSSAILILLLLLSVNLMAQKTDSIASKVDLNEIVVTARKTISKGDHELIFMSDKNRSFGTNALDAVSSLAQFKTDINASNLLSADRKSIYVLINGVPATPNELRSYKGDDIKCVEYYPVAPAQYMTITSGPVANIILKNRIDRFVSVDISTSNSVNTGFGTNQLGLTFADSLNQVKVNYIIDYRHIGDKSQSSVYNYPEPHVYEGENNVYEGCFQYLQTAYQRSWGKHLFNIELNYTHDGDKQKEPTTARYKSEGKYITAYNNSLLNNRLQSFVADLYYKCKFSDKQSLAFNLVNTYSYSTVDNQIEQDGIQSTSSFFSNHVESLIGNIAYELSLWGVKWSIGERSEYKKNRQHYLNDIYQSSSISNFAYLGLHKRFGRVTVYPTVGVNSIETKTEGNNIHNTIPYLRLYTDWWGKGKLEGGSVQMTTLVNTICPTSGQLLSSPTHLERQFVSIGNPQLKPYWNGSITLYLLYFGKNDNYINLSYAPSYSRRPFATTLYMKDGMAYSQPQEISDVVKHQMSLTGSWHPFPWLELAPYLEYYHTSYSTLQQHVCLPYFRYGGGITFPLKSWNLGIYANSPTKEAEGDLIEHGSAQYAAKLLYKYKKWSFGMEWHYSGHNEYTSGKVKDFNYKKTTEWKPLHSLVLLTATCYLSKGKKSEHDDKSLNNTNEDYGLTKDNSPTRPH